VCNSIGKYLGNAHPRISPGMQATASPFGKQVMRESRATTASLQQDRRMRRYAPNSSPDYQERDVSLWRHGVRLNAQHEKPHARNPACAQRLMERERQEYAI
jgi:hypothetical protein